ncbi:hypothetical protein ACTHGU_20725 [Chitinophagaceae bacterium MMS25-I14]
MKQYTEEDKQRAVNNAQKLQDAQSKFWTPIVGIAMIIFGVYMYRELAAIEQNGGTMRIHWFFYAAYKLGGKWLASGLIILIGAGITFSGIRGLIGKKK